MDRRVKYTIMVLKDALIDALQTQHISKVSVKSICEIADVNRSTFYAHFPDQYGLLHFIEQEVMDNITQYLSGQFFDESEPLSKQVLSRILEYVQENAALFSALLSDNCEPDIQMKIMDLAQLFPVHKNVRTDERIFDYLVMYGATGCVSIIRKWLQEGMPEPPSRIANIITQVLSHGVLSFEQQAD